jgi:hypothetical protein
MARHGEVPWFLDERIDQGQVIRSHPHPVSIASDPTPGFMRPVAGAGQ